MSTSRASRSPPPAPRFSRTKESIKGPAAKRGQHTDEVLSQRGFSAKEIGELKAAGVVGRSEVTLIGPRSLQVRS